VRTSETGSYMRTTFAFAILLCGCATAVTTREGVLARCTVEEDNYRKETTVRSMPYSIPGAPSCTYDLIAIRDFSGGDISYGMRIDTYRSSWAFFDSATDSGGLHLAFHNSDQWVGDYGGTYERMVIAFPREYLDAHSLTGLNLRLDGKGVSIVVIIPSHVIAGFLEKTDARFQRR
jgi:hypothetical protein